MGNRAISLDSASRKFESLSGLPLFSANGEGTRRPPRLHVGQEEQKRRSADNLSSLSIAQKSTSTLQSDHPVESGNTMSVDSLRMNDLMSLDDNVADFGWFEEIETPSRSTASARNNILPPISRALSLPTPLSAPPIYILESSLETQQLWYSTAGRRPRQPSAERKECERVWRENFKKSQVNYSMPMDDVVACSPPRRARDRARSLSVGDDSENVPFDQSLHLPFFGKEQSADKQVQRRVDALPRDEVRGEVIFRGKAPFSNSVSKSFVDDEIASITLQMPFYRILKAPDRDVFAEFLIMVTVGGGSRVTFGIWKRHSEFAQFACHIAEINSYSENAQGCFKNSLLSWECVLHRKRWFKSLDKEYLMLKCFLLERFMHDVLFEAPSSDIIAGFLGL